VTAPTRRAALAAGAVVVFAGRAWGAEGDTAPSLSGVLRQGGWVMLRGDPGAPVLVDGTPLTRTGAHGLAVVGFDRDAGPSATVAVTAQGRLRRAELTLAPVAYDIQRIDGLPEDQVAPSDPALLARIAEELKRKQAALASQAPMEGFRDGFVWPVQGAIKTSAFGPQRILNGVPKTPHYGVDLAVPTGTPIQAPADGVVAMAEPHMHFEGGLTLIDHGQGLISMYLHQSRQDVAAGDRVARGQTIGAVGQTGRATGPHLCWRMTWRGRHMDPSLLVGGAAPA
jgi:murein DD-endopeptidase MepM/ murein hydrolase activator NlpD